LERAFFFGEGSGAYEDDISATMMKRGMKATIAPAIAPMIITNAVFRPAGIGPLNGAMPKTVGVFRGGSKEDLSSSSMRKP
jgi:hypothetical protein